MNKISSYIFLSVSFSRVLQISNFILDIFIIISKSAEEKQFRDKREKQILSYTLNHFILFPSFNGVYEALIATEVYFRAPRH